MKTRTLFNVLGPLINPARPKIELMGVYDPALIRPIAETMVSMGMKRAAVVHGSGLDEVAIHGTTQVAEIRDGKIEEYTLSRKTSGWKATRLKPSRVAIPKRTATSLPRSCKAMANAPTLPQ